MEPTAASTGLLEVGLLQVAASALVMLLVGWLWYSPFLFGKAWIRHSGIRPGDIRPRDAQRGRIFSVLVAFANSYLIGLLSLTAQSLTLWALCIVTVWLFIALDQFNNLVWRRDPLSLFLLQAFRSLFVLFAGAMVFYFWR